MMCVCGTKPCDSCLLKETRYELDTLQCLYRALRLASENMTKAYRRYNDSGRYETDSPEHEVLEQILAICEGFEEGGMSAHELEDSILSTFHEAEAAKPSRNGQPAPKHSLP